MATSAVVTPGARTPRTTEHARGGAEGPGALLVFVIMGGRLVGVSQKQRRPVASAALPSLFTVAVCACDRRLSLVFTPVNLSRLLP
ncbi:hypothetical protein B296_00006653 [Ensete ventricosum]|uniref:Uncharacterized protein n=1 Tax=Ensete ventricosum TaxID=4639 RepID=A0A427B6X1_ENSVE|nr:hypothetical protein B296_00006653 [Ensete ventricosum]